VPYDDDPRLVDVRKERCRLEKVVDDIIWEEGVNDPRLVVLLKELARFRELEEKGELYEPTF
jgi:hypothetical protein